MRQRETTEGSSVKKKESPTLTEQEISELISPTMKRIEKKERIEKCVQQEDERILTLLLRTPQLRTYQEDFIHIVIENKKEAWLLREALFRTQKSD